jgi:tRNA pseudouridine55 synthase
MVGVDAVLLVDKPPGRSSHDIVADVRRGRGGRRAGKVGHAGTLDPFATGLLLVLLGRATRAQRFLMALPKTYEAVARFGAVSTTGDPEGEIVATGDARLPPPGAPLPAGELVQRPPAYSAVKVGGRRAYALARRGEAVEVPERTVTVHEATELWRDPPRLAVRLTCSAGTYVRSYVADLGDAYCEALRRTRIGPFAVEDAGREVPLADALAGVLPVVRVEAGEGRRLAQGQAVEMATGAEGPVVVLDPAGLVCVAEPRGAALRATVGFRGA